jgi:hypothetical protein
MIGPRGSFATAAMYRRAGQGMYTVLQPLSPPSWPRADARIQPRDRLKGSNMKQTAIFVPFFSVMLLTLVVWFYMYAKRIPFLQNSKTNLNRLTPAELARISPPAVANPSDNLKNLLELPTLFYGVVLYLFVTNSVDLGYLVAAWIFAAFRVFHSAVHCTVNIVILRFWLYCISTLALWFMLIRAAMGALGAG